MRMSLVRPEPRVGVLAQAEDPGALPRLPPALAVEDQRPRVLLGLRRLVRVAVAADAAPRGQVELVRAVVGVAGVRAVVVTRLARPQPFPRAGRRIGRGAAHRQGQAADEHGADDTADRGAEPLAAAVGSVRRGVDRLRVSYPVSPRSGRRCVRPVPEKGQRAVPRIVHRHRRRSLPAAGPGAAQASARSGGMRARHCPSGTNRHTGPTDAQALGDRKIGETARRVGRERGRCRW